MTKEDRRVTVVLSTYTTKRFKDVMKCISSLKKQTFAPCEIMLVLDPIETLVSFYRARMPPEVKVVLSEDVGLSQSRNTGIKKATGNIIAFIDDDAVPDSTWLEKMVRNYSDPDVIGVGGFIKAEWEGKRPVWFPEELDWIVGCTYKGFPERRSVIRNPIGCNMSFRSWIFQRVGYFRTDIGRLGQKLTGDEETELSIRACSRIPNSKIIYDPSAIVHHKVGKNRENLSYVWTRSFCEGISKATMTYKQKTSQLSTEDAYLKYLVRVAIPSRIKQIHKYEKMCQFLVLLYSTTAVLAGFTSSKL
jgi:glycosyltransferase involved in cell wall biosynthesis